MAELNRLCDSHLPSAALPASGSRGSSRTSQPTAAPRTFTRSYDHKNRSQSRERVISYWLLVICKKIAADQSSPRLRPGKHGRPTTTLDVSTECTEFSE